MHSFIFVVLVLSFVLSVCSLTEAEYRAAFADFRAQYGKTYLPSEVTHRYLVFKNNLDFINGWDAESRGFTVKMNKFGDLSSTEFASIYNGLNITRVPKVVEIPTTKSEVGVAIDWRTQGAVTGVKDQGQCGACWAFSSTGAIEAAFFQTEGTLVSLSEQNLIDCSTAQGNKGCNGGMMDYAFQYVIDNNGLDTEISYPYTATGPNTCKFDPTTVGGLISIFYDLPSGDENALAATVMQRPVSVAIDASDPSFRFYSSGIYYEPRCSSSQLDHAVLVVGYGTNSSGVDYWIVKNSWGDKWGMLGYINMVRNRNNNCGIATAASYPTV